MIHSRHLHLDLHPTSLSRVSKLSPTSRLRPCCSSKSPSVVKNKPLPADDDVAQASKFEKVLSVVQQSLKAKEYADDVICRNVKNALHNYFTSNPEVDPTIAVNNIAVLSMTLKHNDCDVRYLVRDHPLLLKANLLAWAGLLSIVSIPTAYVLHNDPTLLIDYTADNCAAGVDYLIRRSMDPKALTAKIKRYPRLLTLSIEDMLAAEAALEAAGLKKAPIKVIFHTRPDLYLRYSKQRDTWGELVHQLSDSLTTSGLDPNDVLQAAAPLLARKHPAKSLSDKLRKLRGLGLDEDEVVQVVRECPGVLTCSPTELERKWSYLHVVMSAGKQQLLEHPQYLLGQFAADIAAVYAYLAHTKQLHRITGGPQGKVSLELLAREGKELKHSYEFFDFCRQWKSDFLR